MLTNLTGGSLTPASPEWRDSLFALGQLLHDSGRYEQAIAKLEEAVIRYPNAPQALMARYTIARSFHSASALWMNLELASRKNARGAAYSSRWRHTVLTGPGPTSCAMRSVPMACCMISHVVITETLIQTSDLMARCILAVNRYLTAKGLGSVLFSCVSTLHFGTEATQ